MTASSTTSPDGTLLVVSGPSGVGKSSVVDGVLERSGAAFSVSATTRDARPGEKDGEDYFFVTEARFDELVASDELLEWAGYGGRRYGTPRAPVVDRLAAGQDVLLDIENEGAHQVRAAYPGAVLLFILPPSLEELERRLRERGDTSQEDVDRRLGLASQQIEDATETFDHLVVNDDLQSAISQVLSILKGPDAMAFRKSEE
ncbi:MAG: guanylate kinase [Acidimicrobiia bacterium]|nr:MAG: guanylate kinase [Acidimicrobiia bacterium]